MRKAKIMFKNEEAGLLSQHDDGTFIFKYADAWFGNNSKPALSLTFPKSIQVFQQDYLFAFFYNMLPEGANKNAVCKSMRIDEKDYFGLLLATAKFDTIGAITIFPTDIDNE
jgi:HipA-like protein